MKSASYVTAYCNRCGDHRYATGFYGYKLDLVEVDDCWFEMKERVISSRYIEGHAGRCPGCRSVGRSHALVLAQLLYKLDLLYMLEYET